MTTNPGAGPAAGLPLAPLEPVAPVSAVHYAVTTVDARGRLADASALRVLGWSAGEPLLLHVVRSLVVVVTRAVPAPHPAADRMPGRAVGRVAGQAAGWVTRQGHLRLPAVVRHACRIESGGRRLLVAAHPAHDRQPGGQTSGRADGGPGGMLVVYPTAVLDALLRGHYEALTASANHQADGPGSPGGTEGWR